MANDMVTRAQAEAMLKLVEKKYASWLSTFQYIPGEGFDFDKPVPVADANRPHIREWEDDNGGKQLAIVWESDAPYEWALHALDETYTDQEFGFTVEGVSVLDAPRGVHTEAAMSFVLVLYKEV